MKKRVVVLMSGGVDSSVAAYLLTKQGYEVIGITFKLWDCKELTNSQRQLCCSPKDIYDAKHICSQLGIVHYVLDLKKEFDDYVVRKFCEKYISGATPNPCIECNAYIKFKVAFRKIKKIINFDYIATGHYARVIKEDNRYFIAKGKDENKEQSYFLCQILPEVLPRLILPLGELTKKDVREIASVASLKVANKKESFDLCFVHDGDYKKFIISKGYDTKKSGKIVDFETGNFLGYHKGIINYTIGQRNGLGLKNLKTKMYVVKIEPDTNTIYVGPEEYLYSKYLLAKNCIFYEDIFKIISSNNLYAKIRYKSPPAKAKVELVENGIKVSFLDEAVKSVTRGQYVVVYDEKGKILCSGEIM